MQDRKQALEFAIAKFEEMKIRKITPEQMQMELESDLLTVQPILGMPVIMNQSDFFNNQS